MKKSLLLILFSLSVVLHSQSKEYSGIVRDISKTPLPGVRVTIKGTQINTETNFDGYFKITIPNSLNILTFSAIGMQNLDYKVEINKNIEILLEEFSTETKFLDIGLIYDSPNSIFGASISNGIDIQPLAHFEELRTDFLYKLSGQTNFKNDYTFKTNLSLNYPNRHLNIASIEFSQKNLYSKHLFYRDLSLIGSTYLRFSNIALVLKIGHQKFNKQNNFGTSIGLQKIHPTIYYGFQFGYYSDYFNYLGFIKGFLLEDKVGFNIVYEKINNFEFFNFGLSFIFVKSSTNDIILTN